MSRFPYDFFNEYVVRTPLFSRKSFQEQLNQDEISDVKLKEIVNNPVFKESIYLASSNLYEEFDKWLNSEKYPKFTFKGKLSKADFKKDGTYPVTVTGNLTVKETTKEISTPATVTVKAGVITTTAAFPLILADYGIVTDVKKLAKEPKVTVTAEFK